MRGPRRRSAAAVQGRAPWPPPASQPPQSPSLTPPCPPPAAPRFEGFIKKFNELISQMDNYVLKRNSLKLLSEFILDREYFSIMMAYVAEVENLKVVMSALRVAAPNIQFEAFHVFKVFVANPQKTPKIAAILTANKAKLIKFLEDFQNDKGA